MPKEITFYAALCIITRRPGNTVWFINSVYFLSSSLYSDSGSVRSFSFVTGISGNTNMIIFLSTFIPRITGVGRKPSPITEQSSMVVETVEKKPGTGKKAVHFTGDASKVVAKGNGLKKAFTNRLLNVTIDIKDAGKGTHALQGQPLSLALFSK